MKMLAFIDLGQKAPNGHFRPSKGLAARSATEYFLLATAPAW